MADSKGSRGDELREEIDAEIADHLAAATERYRHEGLAPAEAQRRAGERFGQIEAVRQRLWWIHKGEAIMWRTLGIGLLVVVFTGLAVATYGGWRMQRSMDERLAQLTEQLDALNRTQRELLKREEPPPVLQITGRAYLGDTAKPAEAATVQICRLPDKAEDGILTIRSLKTDAQGAFQSGPLPPGDYYVLARLLHDPAIQPDRTYYTQSQPQYLYPGVARPDPIELDVQFHYGTLVLEGSHSVPLLMRRAANSKAAEEAKRIGQTRDERAAVALNLRLLHLDLQSIPWTPARAEPSSWPLVGPRSDVSRVSIERRWGASPEEYREERILLVGRYRLEAYMKPELLDRYLPSRDERDESNLASNLRSRLESGPRRGEILPELATPQDIEILPGETTRVRLEIPKDYQARLQAMLDSDPIWHQPAQARYSAVHEHSNPLPLPLTILED